MTNIFTNIMSGTDTRKGIHLQGKVTALPILGFERTTSDTSIQPYMCDNLLNQKKGRTTHKRILLRQFTSIFTSRWREEPALLPLTWLHPCTDKKTCQKSILLKTRTARVGPWHNRVHMVQSPNQHWKSPSHRLAKQMTLHSIRCKRQFLFKDI